MSFSTTGDSRPNRGSLTEHVFLIRRFLLCNPTKQSLSRIQEEWVFQIFAKMRSKDYNSNNNNDFQIPLAMCQALCWTSIILCTLGRWGQTMGISTVTLPLLQMRKLKLREMDWVPQRFKANNWQSWSADLELSEDEFLCSQILYSLFLHNNLLPTPAKI